MYANILRVHALRGLTSQFHQGPKFDAQLHNPNKPPSGKDCGRKDMNFGKRFGCSIGGPEVSGCCLFGTQQADGNPHLLRQVPQYPTDNDEDEEGYSLISPKGVVLRKFGCSRAQAAFAVPHMCVLCAASLQEASCSLPT